MKGRRGHHLISLLSCACGLAIASGAAAQQVEQGAAEPNAAEIIVTATRRAETLQETPLAVDVVTGQEISKLNLFDVKDIQTVVPGLTLENGDGRSNIATLRGISFNPDSGSSDAVQVYFNEIDVDPNTFFSAIYDIGQIQVLRGPQGLFRGKVSPAGSIVIGSARPDLSKPTGYAQAAASDLHAYNFQGAASVPIIQDSLAVRGALLYDRNRAGQVKNVDGRKSYNETMSGRISFAWQPSSEFRADLVYQYLWTDTRPFRAVFGSGNQPSPNSFFPLRSGPAISLNDRLAVSEGALRFTNETHLITLNTNYNFGWGELVFNGGYQKTRLEQQRDQDEGNAVPGYQLNQHVHTPYDLWTTEVRLQSPSDSRLNWAVAANYDYSKFNDVRVNQSNDVFFTDPVGGVGGVFPGMTGPGPVPPQIFTVPVDVAVTLPILSKSYAVSALLGYEVVDGLTITGGLRQTWGTTTRTQTTTLVIDGGAPTSSVTPSVVKPSALTGGAAISWAVNPDLNLYANYGRSFRPGVAATGVTTDLDPKYLQTPDETSDGFEIGLKSSLFDRKVTLNIAAFYQTFKNYVDFAPDLRTNSSRVPGRTDTATAPLPTFGDAISKGVEVQLGFQPLEWADFNVNATYADAHYDNAKLYCNDYNGDGVPDSIGTPSVPGTEQVAVCTRNDRIADVPKFSLTSNGEVRFAMGSLTPFVRGLLSYRPGFRSQNSDYTYRDFTKIDLFVGLRGEDRWEFNLFVKNLLDQTRAQRVSQGNFQVGTRSLPVFETLDPIPFDSGYRLATITSPREFGATLRFNW
jgi:iron complex outermembrane receptor protein